MLLRKILNPEPAAPSPKNDSSFDEASTIRGSGSVYSVVGHDDPTAVMGNITEKSSHHRSGATISSFLSQQDSDEYREPNQSLQDRSAQLREQLEELDLAANGWNDSSLSASESGRDGPPADIETFYVHEAGAGDTSTARTPRAKTALSGIVEEEQEASDCSEQGDEDIDSEARDRLMPIALRLGLHRRESNEGSSRASGYISSDHSLTSTDRNSSIRSMISTDIESNHEKRDGDVPLEGTTTEGSSNHTIEIVRGVQEALRSFDPSLFSRESTPAQKNDTVVLTTSSEESVDAVGLESSQHKPPSSEHRSRYKLKAYIPIGDDRGASLEEGGKDDDTTELSHTETKRSARHRVLCIMLPVGCVVLFVILIVVFLLAFVDRGNSDVTPPPSPTEDTSPVDTPSAMTSSPTVSPAQAPVVVTPTNIDTPTDRTPTEGEPSNGGGIFVGAYSHLKEISGDRLDDPESPQYMAYQWLVNMEQAGLDLDELPEQTLEQRYIATLLYFATNGSSWIDPVGFLGGGDVCTWRDEGSARGISCDDQGTIESITINQNGLKGSLPFELQALPSLKLLELRENEIGGTVPEEIGNLEDLETLDLRQNRFAGSFPSRIFEMPQLKKLLMLGNKRLEGTIPDSIEKASNLEMISFQRCKLSGSIPSSIGKLSNLYSLTLMGNNMSGSIPSSLTELPKFEVLELAKNQFTGSIPDFAAQELLYFVSLAENRLSNAIPDSIGGLRKLLFLDVRDNSLTGPIPSTISDIPELVTFYAARNRLTGTLPDFGGNNGFLQSVDVADNKIRGNIETLFRPDGPVAEWHTVNVASNLLTGSIPSNIGQYTRLASINMADNQLSGPFPLELTVLSLLNILNLRRNNIDGTLPTEISLLTNLEKFDIRGNRMTGSIPGSLGTLSSVTVVDLSNNKFTGTLPQELESLRGIDELSLQQNLLTGDFDRVLCPPVDVDDGEDSTAVGKITADCRYRGSFVEVTCSCCSTCCTGYGACIPQ